MDNVETMIYLSERKKPLIAYLLWIFLGGFAAHRFYLNSKKMASLLLALLWGGWAFFSFGITQAIFGNSSAIHYLGILMIVAGGILLLIDAFKIPSIIKKYNVQLMERVKNKQLEAL